MANRNSVQRRVDSFLKQSSKPIGEQEASSSGEREPFSPFRLSDLNEALALSQRFTELADGNLENLDRVVAEARSISKSQDLELVKYALMLFITHDSAGRTLKIPPLEAREPGFLRPIPDIELEVAISPDGSENKLDWYREDPSANEHHEHWHLVYPFNQSKDRQGELFMYMHEQMLARYDTERVTVGLSPSASLNDFSQAIVDGHLPVPGLQDTWATRRAGQRPHDIPSYRVSDHEGFQRELESALANNALLQPDGSSVPMTAQLLGATIEANDIDSVDEARYGSFHNMGHMLLDGLRIPSVTRPRAVIGNPKFAISDPVFYRWHRYIDDFSFRWQEKQPANDFTDAPAVLMRKNLPGGAPLPDQSPDIILTFRDQTPGASNRNYDFQSWGQRTFGGQNWDQSFASGAVSTDQLETAMENRVTQGVNISYLDQKEFLYFVRVENTQPADQDVTVRIFLAAVEAAENRRMWIEMDKFRYTLPATSKTVIASPAWRASVIRKPASKPPRPISRPARTEDEEYCNCGWPYNLLLPRGKSEGMPFRLFVMLTDWNLDKVESEETCGSMSYCGTKQMYPDKRDMGYPFDRPFSPDSSIAQTIAAQSNMATRDITIRFME